MVEPPSQLANCPFDGLNKSVAGYASYGVKPHQIVYGLPWCECPCFLRTPGSCPSLLLTTILGLRILTTSELPTDGYDFPCSDGTPGAPCKPSCPDGRESCPQVDYKEVVQCRLAGGSAAVSPATRSTMVCHHAVV